MKSYIQMVKKEDAKTSIKLVLAVIVISVIVVFGVKYAIDFVKKENIKNIQADLLLVRAKIEILKGNNDMNKDEVPLIGYQLNQLPDGVDLHEFFEKHVIAEEEYEKYYLLDKECLEKFELNEFVDKYQGYFIVNYENYEVVYTEGYENENGMWCYKISDLNKLPEPEKIEQPVEETVEQTQTEETEQNEQTEQTEQTEQNV